MELNHRLLDVSQVSLPLDHGTVLRKWTHRELHPDSQCAELMSSCWTMSPKGKKRKPWDLNPQTNKSPPVFQASSSSQAEYFPFNLVRSRGGWTRTNMKTFRASHPAVR